MRHLSSLLFVYAAGCTADAPSSTNDVAGSGKADDTTMAGTLTEVSSDELRTMLAQEAECLHVNAVSGDYNARIKLFCLARGNDELPMTLYLAAHVTSATDDIYKVFEIPGPFGGVPEDVSFRTSGNNGMYSFHTFVPNAGEDDTVPYRSQLVTATLELGGRADVPTVITRFTKQ